MTLRIIAGTFKGRLIKIPKGPSTRPTQGMLREAAFNICQNDIAGARFLDLFAGSGAMAFEALSRGAAHATLIEQNRNAIACIKENIALLQVASQTTFLSIEKSRALTQLHKQGAYFDIVYIDPPYNLTFDLSTILPLLAPEAIVFFEERAKKNHTPPECPPLVRKDSRRFGIALLSIFRYKANYTETT